MTPSGAALSGAIFFLVMFVGSLVGSAVFLANGIVAGAVPCVGMAAILAYAIIANDWPKIWKPLLSGNKQ